MKDFIWWTGLVRDIMLWLLVIWCLLHVTGVHVTVGLR